jgi:hypothetical protein
MLQFLAILMIVMVPTHSYAIEKSAYEREEAEIPKKPSQPPQLSPRIGKTVPQCERYFLYQGNRMECDSYLGGDAERLRPLMSDVPSALSELDMYQANLKKMKLAAYIGTAGILVIIAGIVISRPIVDPSSGALKPGGYVALSGFGISLNSLIYGLSIKKTNEGHLGNAVEYFNAAHPDRPIELQFSTQVNF